MTKTEFESSLKKKILKRRLITLLVFAVFLTIGIVCEVLLKKGLGEDGRYSEYRYYIGIIFGFMIAAIIGFLMLFDFILWSYKTISGGGSFVTIHRGMFGMYLYVDGELVDQVHFRYRKYLEGKLNDNSYVNVILNTYSVHVTFTNGQASMDFGILN